jgi:hypothetical protein
MTNLRNYLIRSRPVNIHIKTSALYLKYWYAYFFSVYLLVFFKQLLNLETDCQFTGIYFSELGFLFSYIWKYMYKQYSYWSICVTNDHGYVPLVVTTFRFFPHSRLITGFVSRLTCWVSLVEQELLTLLGHLSSLPVFSGVGVTQSLVLYVCFVDCCLFFCPFYLVIVLSVVRFTDSDYLPLVSSSSS